MHQLQTKIFIWIRLYLLALGLVSKFYHFFVQLRNFIFDVMSRIELREDFERCGLIMFGFFQGEEDISKTDHGILLAQIVLRLGVTGLNLHVMILCG